jgi:AraC-like DNA-binding protein
MSVREIHVKKQKLPTLPEIGVATEYFPDFVNEKLTIHRLDVVLLSFILRGSCIHQIDNVRYSANGPSIGITHLDQTHCIITGPDGADIMNIYLDMELLSLPELAAPLQQLIPRLLPLNPRFVNRLNRVQQLDLPKDTALTSLAQMLDRELQDRRPGWQDAASAYMRLFLTELCRAARSGALRLQEDPHPSASRLERVRAYIDKHFREPLTLEALSKLAGLSPTYLCRAFRAYAGKPLFTYIQERRIQAAMLALRQSKDKVITIADRCGFNDLSHFNRCFRKFCGRTPVVYRQGGE